jgi:hypothetical protein
MAKAAKEKDKDGKSTLEAAFRALQAGDAIGARRAAKQVIASPSSDDTAAAKRVGKALLGDDAGDPHAETVAADIVRRTQLVPRVYLWALGGAVAYAGLLMMALVRYG